MLFARSALRLPRQAVRQLSAGGSQAEHIEVMEKWKKISFVGLPCVALFAGFCMYKHYAHHHDAEEQISYPHIHIRSKPFPWGSKDCDLFDFACKKKQAQAAE
ncbi:hypothetical protein KFE25_008921 [Diacronema lutheri]|uniref:Uncharacterized protein n=1 Tax=Diacronema lutheri TaxID=2081491 RepID=A0A8J5Y300_DIALT|nr:hypothetical protein KFE25_008921 [Diacronema lutheri]